MTDLNSVLVVAPVAAQTAGVLLILQIGLMLSAGLHRLRAGVPLGLSGDRHLERKVRRHGNLAENAALFVIALALLEGLQPHSIWVAGSAIAFVIARLSHAAAFSSLVGSHGAEGSAVFVALRAIGAFGTALSGLSVAVGLLWSLRIS